MQDNINFIDLVALMRITPDSTVERFGGLINSSFFDASNILGSLKQKGLVDFVTSFPSQSSISVTESGKQLITEAQEKATVPFDTLDMEILEQISSGKRTLQDLTAVVNVTSKDLALHLHKLSVQQFLAYELRNGNMIVTLTEKGFLRVRQGMPKAEQQAQDAASTQAKGDNEQDAVQQDGATKGPDETGPDVAGPETHGAESSQMDPAQAFLKQATLQIEHDTEVKSIENRILKEKRMDRLIVLAIIVVIAVLVAYLYILGII
ncbi:MAG: hypothetical protein KGI06_00600 [Candidatus Micrarchaeota archaeon]|nr:hypothetical protein [Candidatus Micrarchaeota archaeon]